MWWTTTMGDHPALVTGLGAQMIAVVPELELVVVMASEYDITDAAAGSTMVDPESASQLVRAWVVPAVEAAR